MRFFYLTISDFFDNIFSVVYFVNKEMKKMRKLRFLLGLLGFNTWDSWGGFGITLSWPNNQKSMNYRLRS